MQPLCSAGKRRKALGLEKVLLLEPELCSGGPMVTWPFAALW